MGGATKKEGQIARSSPGLSPRGRGNRSLGLPRRRLGRSIPAWAGQPKYPPAPRNVHKVYPRVGGATAGLPPPPVQTDGLSPRGRGNRYVKAIRTMMAGSIPAWAGQPLLAPEMGCLVQVYPRVGGATNAKPATGKHGSGLSPRGRGNRGGWLSGELADGLSPRGRGNRPHLTVTCRNRGSIPAWAGQPRPILCQQIPIPVYPRVGGATRTLLSVGRGHTGLSPRGRGNRCWALIGPRPVRSIPAWAGQPATRLPISPANSVYPRVGGAT